MELRVLKAKNIEKGGRVIMRADFDVPMERGRIQDDSRMRAHASTLRILIGAGARIRLVAHLGRPHGTHDKKLSLAPVARVLERLLGRRVILVSDPFSSAAHQKFSDTHGILLFENIRFWPGEEKNSILFARALARWGDFYVNEAFAASHRLHASVAGVPKILPAYAGVHLAGEVAAMERVMKNPRRPFVAILGGAKIETKLPLVKKFLRDADRILVGGALANTAFSLMGTQVGASRIDASVKIKPSFFTNKKLLLPADAIAATPSSLRASFPVRGIGEIGRDERMVDIGPATQKIFAAHIRDAKTIVWNGPMGIAEIPEYAKGTKAIAAAVIRSGAFSVVGGGDTVAALRRLHMLKGYSHVSTGGGAMLEFLAGKKLPALELLKK